MTPASIAVLVFVAAAHLGVAVYLYRLHVAPSRIENPPDSPAVIVDFATLPPKTPPPQTHQIPPQRPLPVHINDQVRLPPNQTIQVTPPPPSSPLADLKGPATLPNTVEGPPPSPPQPPQARHEITDPHWLSRPTADELANAYPARAMTDGKSGSASLTCTVLVSGALTDCSIAHEDPPGWGFGAAALRLSKRFRLVPREEDGRPVGGAIIRIPIRFALPG